MNIKKNHNKGSEENTNIALVIASYQPNKKASDLLRIALKSIIINTVIDHSIWVIDVASPRHDFIVKPEEFEKVNFVYLGHFPIKFSKSLLKRIIKSLIKLKFNKSLLRNGSYINSWSLNYAKTLFESINYLPKYLMTLQMDVMVTKKGWLKNDMLSKFKKGTIAVGVRGQLCYDKTIAILHSLGCIWDYHLFLENNLDFNDLLPKYDVSEYAIVKAKNLGFSIIPLINSFTNKIEFKYDDPFDKYTYDRTFNDNKEIIFIHLGRGIKNSEDKIFDKNFIGLKEWNQVFKYYNT